MATIKLTGFDTTRGRIAGVGDTDTATMDGSLTIGNADTDTIIVNAEFDSDLVPDDSNTYDLGESEKRWRTLYAQNIDLEGGTLTLDPTSTTAISIQKGGSDVALIEFFTEGQSDDERGKISQTAAEYLAIYPGKAKRSYFQAKAWGGSYRFPFYIYDDSSVRFSPFDLSGQHDALATVSSWDSPDTTFYVDGTPGGKTTGGIAKFVGDVSIKGDMYARANNAAPADSKLDNSSFVVYLDENSNQLKIKVKYANGTVKTGTVALT